MATLTGGELLRFDLKSEETKRVGCGVTVPSGTLGLVNDDKGRLGRGVVPAGRYNYKKVMVGVGGGASWRSRTMG